ncbi:hypothetical protein EDB86DRAFT_2831979 [Lactarius hatsudake]|nr:hypothetical protein EDB86DRAFT_2831979 [Lactarius hatsudake]
MALHYVEKMKAKTPTPRQTLIHELVQEFSMHPRSLGSNDRRDSAFRWITQSLQSLKDTVLLDPAWKRRVQRSYKLLIDKLSAYPEGLKLSLVALRGRAACAAGRGSDEHGKREGRAGGDRCRPASQAAANRRLHTDEPILASILRTVGGCALTEYKYAAAEGTATASIAIPHATSALGGTPISPRLPFRLYLPLLIQRILPRFLSRPGSGLGGPRGARVDARHVPISTSARTRIVWRRYERLLF